MSGEPLWDAPVAPTQIEQKSEIEQRKEDQAVKNEVKIEELQSSKTKEMIERDDAERAARDARDAENRAIINNNKPNAQ